MKKSWIKKAMAVFMAVSLIVSGVAVPGAVQAKAKPKLNKKKVTLKVGKAVKLKLKNAKGKIKWSSSNKSVATVSKKGKVKAKKAGSAKITAKSAGKKYICRVTVKGVGDGGSSQNPGTTAGPNTTKSPNATKKPTTSAKPSASPGANSPGKATTTSSQVLPSTAEEDTLAVGNLNITLGASKAEVEAKIGAKPDRTESTPLGFDAYIYNPSMDYTNYTQIQFDNDRAVCITTISSYFRYENLVAAGEDTEATLKDKGFTSIKSKYDYLAGYMYSSDTEYVIAFVDHQGSGKVYAVGIYSKQTSQSSSINLDRLFKAEYGNYDAAVNETMAKELFDWACAFRAAKGLFVFNAFDSNAAQLHSEDMAANDFVGYDSFDGTKREVRFEEAYAYTGSAECVASRSLDAFGFITWMVDNTESECYAKMVRTADNSGVGLDAYYLCTGFAANREQKDITYATLDLFYY